MSRNVKSRKLLIFFLDSFVALIGIALIAVILIGYSPTSSYSQSVQDTTSFAYYAEYLKPEDQVRSNLSNGQTFLTSIEELMSIRAAAITGQQTSRKNITSLVRRLKPDRVFTKNAASS